MSVYPKKNAKGAHTGLWVIEVVVRGVRHRETATDHATALHRDAVLRGLVKDNPGKVSQTYTIGALRKAARVIWKTTKDESQSLQRFNTVCDLLGDETPLADVRTARLDTLVEELRSRSLGNKTIHRYLATLSAAMKWAVARDHLVGKPVFPWPKTGKGNDTVITEADDRRILARLQKVGSPDIALVFDVLLATGARISEVLGLEPGDVGKGTITFRDTKNGDDRTVYVEEALGRRLAALVLVGMPTYRRVNTALHSARKALKIDYVVTPHVLRHTVGTRLDAAGMSVPAIGKMLGHRNIKTTMGYVHPEAAALKEAATHLRRGDTRGNRGEIPSSARSVPFDQPIEIMEASPRIELGFEDLQSDDNL